MKKLVLVPLLAVSLSTAFIASAAAGSDASATSRQTVADAVNHAAAEVGGLLSNREFVQHLEGAIQQAPGDGVALVKLMSDAGMLTISRAAQDLHDTDRSLRLMKGLDGAGDPLLQARLVLPQGVQLSSGGLGALRVAATPTGDDRDWNRIRTFGADGSTLDIDADQPPPFPLLMVEVDVATALRDGLAVVNEGLRAQGLQPVLPRTRAALDVTRLDYIRLNKDQEPRIKGNAEVFAIVSGLQVDEKKPLLHTVSMPWLDSDKTDYRPGQDLINWGAYRYDVANVQLFEEDGSTNYKDMLSALLKAVTAAVTVAQPELAMVTNIANAVVSAMPDSWLTDGHDYVDSYYLIERGRAYEKKIGAAGNATVSLSPITIGK